MHVETGLLLLLPCLSAPFYLMHGKEHCANAAAATAAGTLHVSSSWVLLWLQRAPKVQAFLGCKIYPILEVRVRKPTCPMPPSLVFTGDKYLGPHFSLFCHFLLDLALRQGKGCGLLGPLGRFRKDQQSLHSSVARCLSASCTGDGVEAGGGGSLSPYGVETGGWEEDQL